MEHRMAQDAVVLQRVIDDHELTVKQIALRSGIAAATIYRYLTGERTLPTDCLRAVFELTGDLRILHLVTGCIPVRIEICVPEQSAIARKIGAAAPAASANTMRKRIPPLRELLPRTCASVEAAARSVKYMAKVVEDGRIDRSDAQAIANFRRDAAAASEDLALAVAGLTVLEQKGMTP